MVKLNVPLAEVLTDFGAALLDIDYEMLTPIAHPTSGNWSIDIRPKQPVSQQMWIATEILFTGATCIIGVYSSADRAMKACEDEISQVVKDETNQDVKWRTNNKTWYNDDHGLYVYQVEVDQ